MLSQIPQNISEEKPKTLPVENKNLTTVTSSSDPLINEIVNKLLNKQKENCAVTLFKSVLYIPASLFGLTTGIAFMNPAYEFVSEKSKALGWLFSVATLICYDGGGLWANFGLLNKIFSTTKNNLVSNFFKINTAIVLGITATVPQCYLVYKYNNKNFVWPIIQVTTGLGYSCYGFFNFFENEELHAVVQNLKNIKKRMCSSAQDNSFYAAEELKQNFIQVFNYIQQDKKLFYKILQTIEKYKETNIIDHKQILEEILTIIFNHQNQYANFPKNSSWLGSMTSFFVKLVGGGLPLAGIVLAGTMSYQASNLLFENIYLRSIMTGITIIPNATIQILSARRFFANIYDTLLDVCTNNFSTSLIADTYPLTYFLLTICSIGVAAISFGPSAKVIIDEILPPWQYILLTNIIIAEIAFHIYLLRENSKNALSFLGLKFGDVDTKNKFSLSNNLDSLMHQLENTSAENLLKLSNELSNETSLKNFHKFGKNADTSNNKLTNYQPTHFKSNIEMIDIGMQSNSENTTATTNNFARKSCCLVQ